MYEYQITKHCYNCKVSTYLKDRLCARCIHDSNSKPMPYSGKQFNAIFSSDLLLPYRIVQIYKEQYGKSKDEIAFDNCKALRQTLKQFVL